MSSTVEAAEKSAGVHKRMATSTMLIDEVYTLPSTHHILAQSADQGGLSSAPALVVVACLPLPIPPGPLDHVAA